MHSVTDGQKEDPSHRSRAVSRATVVSALISVTIPLLFSLVLAGCSRSHDGNGRVLATVGKTTISLASLNSRLSNLQLRIGIPDNGDTRKQLLQGMIDDRLLLLEAQSRGLDRDARAKAYRASLEQRILLDEYARRHVLVSITVSEGELETLFVRLNTKVEARHLFAQTFAQARAYRNRLLQGESFEELAKEAFTDPRLRNNGGLLEPFSVDEMDPAFERAAFEQPLYSISEPVELKHGYSIIQVLSRTTRPLLTEQQFIEKKQDLEKFLRARKRPEAFKRHADSLRTNVLHLEFDPVLLSALFQEMQSARNAEGPLIQVVRSQLDPEMAGRTLARVQSGKVTVAEGVELLKQATSSELEWVLSSRDLEDLIAGVLLRDRMLAIARKEKLHKTNSYNSSVNEEFDMYLVQRMSDSIVAESEIPMDTLRAFFNRNSFLFRRPDAIQLKGIQVTDARTADEIARRLENGESFADLASRFSVHPESAARGGDLGVFTKARLGPQVYGVWALQQGDWIGPVKTENGMFSFFQVTDRLAARIAPFDEIIPDAIREYRKMYRQQILSDFAGQLRRNTIVKVNEEVLLQPRHESEGAL
ncbi:MAG: peptidylprolyl isomerase [bacterium]